MGDYIHEAECVRCSHAEVCIHKKVLTDTQIAVGDTAVRGLVGYTTLKSIEWISPVKLECKYFINDSRTR